MARATVLRAMMTVRVRLVRLLEPLLERMAEPKGRSLDVAVVRRRKPSGRLLYVSDGLACAGEGKPAGPGRDGGEVMTALGRSRVGDSSGSCQSGGSMAENEG